MNDRGAVKSLTGARVDDVLANLGGDELVPPHDLERFLVAVDEVFQIAAGRFADVVAVTDGVFGLFGEAVVEAEAHVGLVFKAYWQGNTAFEEFFRAGKIVVDRGRRGAKDVAGWQVPRSLKQRSDPALEHAEDHPRYVGGGETGEECNRARVQFDLRRDGMKSLRFEFDADYGIDKRTGWTVSVDGSMLVQFGSFDEAFAAVALHSPHFQALVFMIQSDTRADEIMRRRWWFPRFMGTYDGKQRWTVFSWAGVKDLRDTMPVWFEFPDRDPFIRESPVQCLIAADEWFKANVDQPAPVQKAEA